MAYDRIKYINGQPYIYRQESYRVNGKVRTRHICYVGKGGMCLANSPNKDVVPNTEQQFQEQKIKFENNAIKEFGKTENFNEAGYMLDNGEMLDFSGKKDGGTPNMRSYDHREINRAIFYDDLDQTEKEFSKDSTYNDVLIFMNKTGAIRTDFQNEIKLDMNKNPTQEQKQKIASAFIQERKRLGTTPNINVDYNKAKPNNNPDKKFPLYTTKNYNFNNLGDFERFDFEKDNL